MTELERIEGYKKDFKYFTGKGLKCIITSMRIGDTNFISEGVLHPYTAIDLIFNYTEWNSKEIFGKAKPNRVILKRSIIYFILCNNGVSISEVARIFNKDHTTIINSLKNFEFELETDYYTQKLFNEILNNLKEYYNPKKLLTLQEFNIKYDRT